MCAQLHKAISEKRKEFKYVKIVIKMYIENNLFKMKNNQWTIGTMQINKYSSDIHFNNNPFLTSRLSVSSLNNHLMSDTIPRNIADMINNRASLLTAPRFVQQFDLFPDWMENSSCWCHKTLCLTHFLSCHVEIISMQLKFVV